MAYPGYGAVSELKLIVTGTLLNGLHQLANEDSTELMRSDVQ